MEKVYRLVVRQRHIDSEILDRLVETLRVRFGIEPYSARINLKGEGLSIFAMDRDEARLYEIAGAIEEYEYECFVSDMKCPDLKPFIARSFKLTNDALIFKNSLGREVEVLSGARLVAVMASFESSLAGKLLRKASNSSGLNARISAQEKYAAIMKSGRVIVDLYIFTQQFPDDSDFIAPIRLSSGGFDPSSLGKYATHSSVKNFETALRIIRKYAGDFKLELDFGFFNFPGMRQEAGDSEANNLKALGRYGCLLQMLYFRKDNRSENESLAAEKASVFPMPGTITAANVTVDNRQEPNETAESEPKIRPRVLGDPPPEMKSHIAGPTTLWIVSVFIMLSLFGGTCIAAPILTLCKDALLWWWIFMGRNGISFFALALVFFFMTFRYLKLKRLIQNTPTSKARSLSMGMVEIKGAAERMYNLMAPISQTPCVYYRLKKYVRHEKQRKQDDKWVLTEDINSGRIPFILRDETGSVLINPKGACLHSLRSETFVGGFSSHGLGAAIPADVKFVEEIIPELASLYVLGFASPHRKEMKSIENLKNEKLRQLKQNPEGLAKYDENNDGRIDEREWENARRDAEYSALKDALSEKNEVEKSAEKALIHKPPYRGLPFIIADDSEEKLLFWFNFRGVLYFAGAIAFSVIGIVVLIDFLTFG